MRVNNRNSQYGLQKVVLAGGTSRQSAYATLFGWTNETLNAWTLFPGVVIALYAVIYARSGSTSVHIDHETMTVL